MVSIVKRLRVCVSMCMYVRELYHILRNFSLKTKWFFTSIIPCTTSRSANKIKNQVEIKQSNNKHTDWTA